MDFRGDMEGNGNKEIGEKEVNRSKKGQQKISTETQYEESKEKY
jgi:hypothetical protein